MYIPRNQRFFSSSLSHMINAFAILRGLTFFFTKKISADATVSQKINPQHLGLTCASFFDVFPSFPYDFFSSYRSCHREIEWNKLNLNAIKWIKSKKKKKLRVSEFELNKYRNYRDSERTQIVQNIKTRNIQSVAYQAKTERDNINDA